MSYTLGSSGEWTPVVISNLPPKFDFQALRLAFAGAKASGKPIEGSSGAGATGTGNDQQQQQPFVPRCIDEKCMLWGRAAPYGHFVITRLRTDCAEQYCSSSDQLLQDDIGREDEEKPFLSNKKRGKKGGVNKKDDTGAAKRTVTCGDFTLNVERFPLDPTKVLTMTRSSDEKGGGGAPATGDNTEHDHKSKKQQQQQHQPQKKRQQAPSFGSTGGFGAARFQKKQDQDQDQEDEDEEGCHRAQGVQQRAPVVQQEEGESGNKRRLPAVPSLGKGASKAVRLLDDDDSSGDDSDAPARKPVPSQLPGLAGAKRVRTTYDDSSADEAEKKPAPIDSRGIPRARLEDTRTAPPAASHQEQHKRPITQQYGAGPPTGGGGGRGGGDMGSFVAAGAGASKPKSAKKGEDTCRFCGSPDHLSRRCPNK